MIRIDALWLAVEPLDMRCGVEKLLARAVAVFGRVRPHHGYLFANRTGTRMKLVVHDGIGVWLAARRLNRGRFVWSSSSDGSVSMSRPQFDALILGLPWEQIEEPISLL